MLQKDTVWIGLIAAILFPLTTWITLTILSDSGSGINIFGNTFIGFQESFIATMAVCSNFLPFFVYMRARKDNAMRGVGLITMVLALIVMVKYFLLAT